MKPEPNVHQVIVRREIDAPVDRVFDAWLDPESLALWMRPGNVEDASVTVNAHVGGRFEILMRGSQTTLRHSGVYQVIDRPRRLVFTWVSAATQQGDSLVTIEFNSRGPRTEVVLTQERLPSAGAARDHTSGWTRILELLALHCAASPTLSS